MGKRVIALGRQFGSGGREIAYKLSQALGFAYYDRELITLAAERAEVSEALFAEKDEKAANPWLFKAFYDGGPKARQGGSAEDVHCPVHRSSEPARSSRSWRRNGTASSSGAARTTSCRAAASTA